MYIINSKHTGQLNLLPHSQEHNQPSISICEFNTADPMVWKESWERGRGERGGGRGEEREGEGGRGKGGKCSICIHIQLTSSLFPVTLHFLSIDTI